MKDKKKCAAIFLKKYIFSLEKTYQDEQNKGEKKILRTMVL